MPLVKLKIEDAKAEHKCLHRVKTVVSFENEIDEKEKNAAKDANLEVITWNDVIEAGKKSMEKGNYKSIIA